AREYRTQGRRDLMTQHTRALLAEACGTFWFFFIGAGAIITAAVSDGTLLNVALAHGITLAIAVSTFGVVSGGHFNPAVTFGLAIARQIGRAHVCTPDT